MVKIIFPVMGCERISVESLSAILKQGGHETYLAFDPALFCDKLYFNIPKMAKIFDIKDKVINDIIKQKPDLVAFSVFVDNFHWACYMANQIKKSLDIPIIFGGVYATMCPENVIKQNSIDMVCLGEGEYPLLELANSIKNRSLNYKIKNIWFKKNGKVIKNKLRHLNNLDEMPMYDKEFFEKEFLYKECYMTVTQKGCPFNCTYCSMNFYRNFESKNCKGTYLRRRNMNNILNELKIMKEKYKYKEIFFQDNTFTDNKKWTLEFLEKYNREIGVPFRIMTHPLCVDDEVAKALKNAKCHRVQLGVQSMHESTKRNILHRPESNEQTIKCFRALDKYRVSYSIDHIFGLPFEKEEEQIEAARIYSKLKSCCRLTIFYLDIFPKTEMVDIAKKAGMVNNKGIKNIEEANEPDYLSGGSLRDKDLKKMFKCYQILFRAIPIIPERLTNFILDYKIQRFFRYLPSGPTLFFIDQWVSIIKSDYSAFQYLRHYFYQMPRVLKKKIKYKIMKK